MWANQGASGLKATKTMNLSLLIQSGEDAQCTIKRRHPKNLALASSRGKSDGDSEAWKYNVI